MIEAYPLHWPAGKPRTDAPRSSAFGKKTFAQARDFTLAELNRLGAREVVISTNLETRQDGLPYSRSRIPEDKGVAVYFEWCDRQMCFACDQWDKLEHNIYAIGKTIEAMRGIERWGSSDMMRAAFSGFEALPAPRQSAWYQVLGVSRSATEAEIKVAFKAKYQAAQNDAERMALNQAYQESKAHG